MNTSMSTYCVIYVSEVDRYFLRPVCNTSHRSEKARLACMMPHPEDLKAVDPPFGEYSIGVSGKRAGTKGLKALIVWKTKYDPELAGELAIVFKESLKTYRRKLRKHKLALKNLKATKCAPAFQAYLDSKVEDMAGNLPKFEMLPVPECV